MTLHVFVSLLVVTLAGGSPDPYGQADALTASPRASLPAMLGQVKPDKAIIPTPGPTPRPSEPIKISAKPGDIVAIESKAATLPRFDFDEVVFAGSRLDSTRKTLFLPTRTPGTHKVSVWINGKESEPPELEARYHVTIAGGPLPPQPGPGPGPQPTDLRTQLTTTFQADLAAGNGTRDQARDLGKLYERAARAGSSERFKQVKELIAWFREAVDALMFDDPGALPSMRKVASEYLNKNLPRDDKPFDNTTRVQVRDVFRELSVIIAELVKEQE